MNLKFTTCERRGPVLVVTIDRPDARNALNVEAHHELGRIFDDFEDDPSLRVAIITGAGNKAFCAGSDIKDDVDPDRKPVSGFAGLSRRFDLRKPVIAAVNGFALGGGVEILLSCDIAVAVESARFGFPEPRVGLAAIEGGLQRLAQHIPFKFAMQMLLTCETIDAATALRFGLVNEVVHESALLETAMRYASAVVAGAPLAIEATKAVVMQGMAEAGVTGASVWRHQVVTQLWESSDAIEGISAFTQRRQPVWKGK
ncbi:enoyl-CoA hydratase-related protein [Paraburkholderia fungorum]|uniref:enoyl-CoA hydratase-related protein n=1 Tax=Paraburkholderia fungorum TaxID=134537 RepID=UPI00209750A9|nr:enoyl-CoA hydratase-related protein [Paraburkholderia fungorum]USX06754.1 enoyl-CoA hydratase-related protein [Paraburkholderia fungorum]